MTTDELLRLVLGVTALLALALGVLRTAGVRVGAAPALAVVRGALQLAAVGLVLRGVLDGAPVLAVAVLAVMLVTAVLTASHRLAELQGRRAAVLAVGVSATAGAGAVLGVVFALGLLPLQPRYAVALGGIVLGETMTAATLAGRHLLSGLRTRRDEVEGWLALGAPPRRAVVDVARRAVAEALVPGTDTARATGLVTLPGAFVGALLGGASPLDAARFQVVVLASLAAASSVVAVLVTSLLGAPRRLPVPETTGAGRAGARLTRPRRWGRADRDAGAAAAGSAPAAR